MWCVLARLVCVLMCAMCRVGICEQKQMFSQRVHGACSSVWKSCARCNWCMCWRQSFLSSLMRFVILHPHLLPSGSESRSLHCRHWNLATVTEGNTGRQVTPLFPEHLHLLSSQSIASPCVCWSHWCLILNPMRWMVMVPWRFSNGNKSTHLSSYLWQPRRYIKCK